MDDVQLLKRYVKDGSQEAFAGIVRRHVDLVYGTARRLVGDEQLAEDVAQAAFLVLAQKAKQVEPGRLAGWLVNAVRLAAHEARRSKLCRQKHEWRAAQMRSGKGSEEASGDEPTLAELSPLLDEALCRLREADRTAVAMRFLQGRSFAEVAGAMGLSEEAARKRVERAVEKLRGVFMKKGFAPSVGGLMVVLAAHQAQAAPAGLAGTISATAISGGTGTSVILAKGAMKMMVYAKVKVVAVVVATGLLVGGTIAGVTVEDPTRPAQPRLEQAQKVLDADLAALRQKGEPVTVQDLSRVPMPDAENAVVDLRAAVKLFDTAGPTFDAYNKMDSVRLPLVGKDAASLRALVTGNQRSLDLIRSAAAKAKVDWRIKYPSPMAGMLLTDLSAQRRLASLAQVAAFVAHADGKDREALEHVRQLLFIAHATGRLPFLVCHRVEFGIEDLAFDVCGQISSRLQLHGDPHREELRRTIAELLDEKDLHADLRWSLQSERVEYVDMAHTLAAKPTALNEMLKAMPDRGDIWVKPADVGAVALEDCHLMLNTWQRYTDAVGAVDWRTARERTNPWYPPEMMEPGKHFFMKMMLPAMKGAFEKQYTAMAKRRLAATALAIRWYSLEHEGRLPESLGVLVPKYLPAVPDDPFTIGHPLVFNAASAFSAATAVVYSVGINEIDDGGDPIDETPQNPDIVVRLR